MTTNYATMRTIKNVAAMETNKYRLTQQQQQQQELLQTAHELPTSTKHKFRRAVHAIVWLGRARGSAGTNKGSFKEYRENSQARSNKKLFYTSAW
ncbi:unnamed protein product, partial [Rotaria magnacalcarata]